VRPPRMSRVSVAGASDAAGDAAEGVAVAASSLAAAAAALDGGDALGALLTQAAGALSGLDAGYSALLDATWSGATWTAAAPPAHDGHDSRAADRPAGEWHRAAPAHERATLLPAEASRIGIELAESSPRDDHTPHDDSAPVAPERVDAPLEEPPSRGAIKDAATAILTRDDRRRRSSLRTAKSEDARLNPRFEFIASL